MRRNLPLAAKRQARAASRNACMTDSIAKMVRNLQVAFREGLTAHREYERTHSRRVCATIPRSGHHWVFPLLKSATL